MNGGLMSLMRRIWVDCEIELLEPLRVGAGRDPFSSIDLPVLKDFRGVPIIPGSTLKGFFRSYLSGLLLAYKLAGGKELELEGINLKLEPCVDSISENKIDLKELDELCVLDRLFGYSGRAFSLASLVRLTDAEPLDSSLGTLRRTHVSIDSGRDAARSRMLGDVEASKERDGDLRNPTRYKFTMVFDELSDPGFSCANDTFKLLLKLLSRGIEGFIGGWKSRGYGRVIVRISGIRVAEVGDLIQGDVREATLNDVM
ncbi:MAG: RAMP superfamily CRISPR-associated protein [Candidatus Korarchaeum sp.]